jgi:hypothetical protein
VALAANKRCQAIVTCWVTAGDDTMTGSDYGDSIEGIPGDSMYGLEGNDVLDARGGPDALTGGSGNDSLRGGDDADVYRFGDGWGVGTMSADADCGNSVDFGAQTQAVTVHLISASNNEVVSGTNTVNRDSTVRMQSNLAEQAATPSGAPTTATTSGVSGRIRRLRDRRGLRLQRPKGTLTYNSFLRGVRDEGSRVREVRTGYRMDWGGVQADVIAPPGEPFSETNDNSVWPSS